MKTTVRDRVNGCLFAVVVFFMLHNGADFYNVTTSRIRMLHLLKLNCIELFNLKTRHIITSKLLRSDQSLRKHFSIPIPETSKRRLAESIAMIIGPLPRLVFVSQWRMC